MFVRNVGIDGIKPSIIRPIYANALRDAKAERSD